MRIARWDATKADFNIYGNAMDRLQAACEQVADRARQMVPEKTGALKASIRVVRLKGDPRKNVRVYAGSKKVYYARFVERGTKHLPANPFMRKAFNAVKAQIKTILQGGA